MRAGLIRGLAIARRADSGDGRRRAPDNLAMRDADLDAERYLRGLPEESPEVAMPAALAGSSIVGAGDGIRR